MPNPKRRHSKSRRNKRRAHDAITAPLLMACPQCKEMKEPHRVCPKCGYYAAAPRQEKRKNELRQVIEVEEV
ncbi:MAG: 50S ribosomal protein L32 [Acidobacteriota bacterium]